MAKLLRIDKENEGIAWEEALQEFLFWKQAQGVSERTLSDYRLHISQFFRRYPSSWKDKSLRKAILEYMAYKIKPATYNLRLVYLRAFFQWCINEGYKEENPLQDFKRKKAPGRVVDISLDTLQELLSLPNKNTFPGLRDYTLILLTLDTGIRPKEAFSLRESDIDFKHLTVTILAEVAKTRVQRVLPITSYTAEHLRKLIKVRHPGWENNVPIFCTCDGKPMKRDTWRERLALYSEQIGIKIRPYDLRHAFAIIYLRNGGNAFGLQNTLGHVDMQMTRRYVNLTGQDLRKEHFKASPLNTLLPKKKCKRVRNIQLD